LDVVVTLIASRPSFALVDHDGNPVTEHHFRGKFVLVFFGFTHCAMVCPRALERLSAVLSDLGPDAERFTPLYISVDPDRDSPEVMKAFLQSRAPAFTGLTGTQEKVEDAKRAFRVFAQRRATPDAPDGYTVPHTAITYLLSPDGRFLTHFGDAVPAPTVVARLRSILNDADLSGRSHDG
jgi:protein SCO1/2